MPGLNTSPEPPQKRGQSFSSFAKKKQVTIFLNRWKQSRKKPLTTGILLSLIIAIVVLSAFPFDEGEKQLRNTYNGARLLSSHYNIFLDHKLSAPTMSATFMQKNVIMAEQQKQTSHLGLPTFRNYNTGTNSTVPVRYQLHSMTFDGEELPFEYELTGNSALLKGRFPRSRKIVGKHIHTSHFTVEGIPMKLSPINEEFRWTIPPENQTLIEQLSVAILLPSYVKPGETNPTPDFNRVGESPLRRIDSQEFKVQPPDIQEEKGRLLISTAFTWVYPGEAIEIVVSW